MRFTYTIDLPYNEVRSLLCILVCPIALCPLSPSVHLQFYWVSKSIQSKKKYRMPSEFKKKHFICSIEKMDQSKSFNKSTLCANTLLDPVKGSWDTYPQIILSIHTGLHNFSPLIVEVLG